MLRVPRAVLDEVLAHAREAAPLEACGMLAGRGDAVERAFRVRNAHPRPATEYLLDPQEQLRLTLHVEDELGLELVGFYHSHPAGPARFSALDEARASWPGARYLLAYLQPTEGVLCARLEGARLVPETIDDPSRDPM